MHLLNQQILIVIINMNSDVEQQLPLIVLILWNVYSTYSNLLHQKP